MAAALGGVSRRTLYEWIYKGREVRELREEDPAQEVTPYDEDYLWFLINFEQAENERKIELLRRIDAAGEKSWQANAWMLERMYPDEFSLRQRVQVEAPDDKEVFTLNIGSTPRSRQLPEADYEIVDSDG